MVKKIGEFDKFIAFNSFSMGHWHRMIYHQMIGIRTTIEEDGKLFIDYNTVFPCILYYAICMCMQCMAYENGRGKQTDALNVVIQKEKEILECDTV